jgi:hypothetical protein
MIKFFRKCFLFPFRVFKCERFYTLDLIESVFFLSSLGCICVLYGVVFNLDINIGFGIGFIFSSFFLSFYFCFRFPILFFNILFVTVYYSFIAFLCRFFFSFWGIEYV